MYFPVNRPMSARNLPATPEFLAQHELLDGDKLNVNALQEKLGIKDQAGLTAMLVYLYATDPLVNWDVNRGLVRLYELHVNKGQLPPLPPDHSEFAWFEADRKCESCPGSELYEFGTGFFLPKCLSFKRADKYMDCMKYRENLTYFDQQVADQATKDVDSAAIRRQILEE